MPRKVTRAYPERYGNRRTVADRVAVRMQQDHGKQILTFEDSRALFTYFIDELIDELLEKGRVEIRGLGIFSIKTIRARKVRNPKTRKEFLHPESKRATWKPSVVLKRLLVNPATKTSTK